MIGHNTYHKLSNVNYYPISKNCFYIWVNLKKIEERYTYLFEIHNTYVVLELDQSTF